MLLREWDELPEWMRTTEVKEYYDVLVRKKYSLILKRIFDIAASFLILISTSPLLLILAIAIVIDSPGGVFYRQVRVTSYGRKFRIHKFRTMVANADKIGSQVTVGRDERVTKIGMVLRKYRLDEIPQLLDVMSGKMSFVGTRPEVPQFVDNYTEEMKATLLLPAGITSEASIRFKDEAELLDIADDVNQVYIEEVLPKKMKYNLRCIKRFSFIGEMATMFRTVFTMLGKKYSDS